MNITVPGNTQRSAFRNGKSQFALQLHSKEACPLRSGHGTEPAKRSAQVPWKAGGSI